MRALPALLGPMAVAKAILLIAFAGTAAFTAVKHQAFQILTAQVTYFMLANYPADAVDNIAFATAVWPDNAGNAFIKMKHGFIRKTFKPFNFKTL